MKYSFNGKLYDKEDLVELKESKEPIFAFGSGLPDQKVIYAFKNETDLYAWARDLPVADSFERMREGLRKARGFKDEDNTAILERQATLAKRIKEDLAELSKRTGLPANSKQLFLRATEKAGILEGRIFDPAMLFTGTGFSGNAVGLTVSAPNLAIFPGMNNTVSSVQAIGVCRLFAGTFFQGASRLLLGLPYIQNSNLTTIGFNNVTSSVFIA